MGNFTFISDKIRQIQKEIGLTNFTGFFEIATNALPKITEQKKITIDVYYSALALPTIREAVTELQKESAYNFILKNAASKCTSDFFPNIQPSVALLLIDNDFIKENFVNNIVNFKKEDYRFIFIKNYTDNKEIEELLKRKLHLNVEFITLQTDVIDLHKQISNILKDKDSNKLIDLSIAQSCMPLIVSLREVLETETKINSTQKQLISQDNNILRKEESNSNNNEVTIAARLIIQKNLLDIEKGFKSKYDEMNKPNIGGFSIAIDKFIENNVAFEDIEQISVAEKNEKIETKLSQIKIDEFKKNLSNNLNSEIKKDLLFLNDSSEEAVKKVNILLVSKGLKKIKPENFLNPSIENEKIITANNYIQRPYVGELTKKGVMEYFIALRDYTGMIMVVIGILSPLLMLSSVSSETGNSKWTLFLNTVSSAMKPLKQGLQIFTIIVLFIMIIYGIFDLRKRIPRKREEEKDREVKKAKESLSQEGKRIYMDSSRDWTAMLSNYIKEFAQNISNELDNILKAASTEKQFNITNKRGEMQITQQSIELKSRNIQMAEKEYEMLYKRVVELKEKLNN